MPVPTYLLIPRLTLLVALTALTTAAPVIRADDAPSEPSAASSDAVADAAAEGTSTPSSTAGTETDEAEKAQEAPPTPPPPPPIDQQPYRVLVVLGVAPDPDLNAAVRNQILTGVRERIDSRLGPLWDADVELADWIQPGRRAVLQSLTQEGLNARFLESEFDKVFVATVEAEGIATRLSAREWDKNSQTVTADTSSLNYEPRVVVDRLFAEILAHFRPIAEVEEISEDGNSLEMRIRGGELLPPDAALRPAEVGAYLRPYYRYLNRKKELMKLQDLPWTYLQITEVTRGRMKAEIHSAFKGALASARRRTELMAIGVKIRFDETRIRIYPRGQVDNPLS
ncbi:MAG: hypothetical protein KDA75_21470, partial [Planctomycetaceae bacterium]|nr:hypothetical protein [Planctomycetaceae bacterium]